RARYAVEVNGFAPTSGPGPLEIRAGRHPLLLSSPPVLLSVPERGDVATSPSPFGRGGQGVRTDPGASESAVVPFDLVLAPDEFNGLVSGPNTGGKTVVITAVGLLAVIAQRRIVPPS